MDFRRKVGQATVRHAFMHADAAEGAAVLLPLPERHGEEGAISKADQYRGEGLVLRPDQRGGEWTVSGADDCLECFEECDKKITVRNLPDYYVLYERRIGSYRHLSRQWGDFIRKYQEYVTKDTLFLERTFDDPVITDMDGCLYDICMSVDRGLLCGSVLRDGASTCTIEGGRCAVYPYKGLGKHIYAAYQTIFTVWLPRTSYRLDYRSGFDIYHMVDSETGYMEMDICIPLRE